MFTQLNQLNHHNDEEVTIRGWIYNLRSSGKIIFLQIRDGLGFSQAIVSQQQVPEPVWQAAQDVTVESSVELTGLVSRHPKFEEFEIQVRALKILQRSAEYPIGKKEHGPDFLLNNRHLWLRSPRQWAIQRVRDVIIQAINDHLHSENFTRFDSPILTPTSCEDTTQLFGFDYFPKENDSQHSRAYLTQSGQLYLEAAIFSLGRVYDFGPVFRAEKSKTRRHLTEFWMMDAEAAFVEHNENMEGQERLILAIIKTVLDKCDQELKILERDTAPLKKITTPFPRLTHLEAVQKLRQLGSDFKKDDDLGGDDETLLTKEFASPVFIEKYPAKVKAFYMKRDPQDENRVLCADLLAPEGYGEIIGGSQREDDYDTLKKRLDENNLPLDAFKWYVDLRKYGSVPHSGYGLGLERVISWICGLKHVRETIPFPRMINRIYP